MEQPPDKHKSAIDTVLREVLRGRSPGASILVRRGGQLAAEAHVGFADLVNGRCAERNTKFCAGSILKQFVAAAAILVARGGGPRIETPVRTFFPDFPKFVTLRHLLTHTSGITRSFDQEIVAAERVEAPLEIIVERVSRGTPASAPGAQFIYSNTGYYLIARILELETGESLATLLERLLFRPCGLLDTELLRRGEAPPKLASGYASTAGGFSSVSCADPAASFGSGNLATTGADLARWSDSLWITETLAPDLANEMAARPILLSGDPSSYGLGVYVGSSFGALDYSHDGNSAGFSCQVASYPAAALTISVMLNANMHIAEEIEKAIATRIIGEDQRPQDCAPLECFTAVAGDYALGDETVCVSAREERLSMRTPAGRLVTLLPLSKNVYGDDALPGVIYEFVSHGAQSAIRITRYGKMLAVLRRVR